MRINCEIPDDVGEILKEFLLASKKDAQNIAQRMVLFVVREAGYKLLKHWRGLNWGNYASVDWGGKEKTQEEIERRIDILEKFCREQEEL